LFRFSFSFSFSMLMLATLLGPLACAGAADGDPEPDAEPDAEPDSEPDPEPDAELCDGCCVTAVDDCAASEVCRFREADLNDPDAVGACVGAENLSYDILVFDLSLCERKTDGSEWDAGAGAPDPRVDLVLNGSVVSSSPEAADSFNAFGDGILFTQTLRSTDSLTVQFVDVDLFEDDYIEGVCLGPACDAAVGVETLRGVAFEGLSFGYCATSSLASVDIYLLPTPN
jgi:hypothetical protein